MARGAPTRTGSVAAVTVPSAQLRAFVPLDDLEEHERVRWSAPAAAPLGVRAARAQEARSGRTRLLTGRGSFAERAVLTRRVGDEVFVCPLQLDVRAALALRELRSEVPGPVVDLLVPDRDVRGRLDALAASGRRPTIIDGPWGVPVAWFTLFDDTERRLRDPAEGTGPHLSYLTTCARALPRIERAVDAVDDAVEDADGLLEDLADLLEWVEAFPERALLELDYAGLVQVLSRDELEADHSAHDVWSAVAALEQGDPLAAVAYYGALQVRWGPLQARAHAS